MQILEKAKIETDEHGLILAALKSYEFLTNDGQLTCDIASFLYEEKDYQDILEKCGFPASLVSDFLRWHPNHEEWLAKLGVSKEIIELANDQVEVEIPGYPPAMFSHLDFIRDKAWERMKKADLFLKLRDFVNPEKFKKYFFIAMGMLEGTVIVYGKERSGKSLFSYHTAYQLRELFGKRCTLKPKPKKTFGDYDSITMEQVEEEIELLRRITGMANDLTEDDEVNPALEELLCKSKLYKRVFVVDESYQELENKRQTNITIAYGRLVRQYGHLHTLFMFISPDEKDIARRLIYNRRTHEVGCSKYGGICHYTITWVREGISRSMELNPKDWSWLWNSTNLVGDGSHLKMRI
jgi:hypothetical protein